MDMEKNGRLPLWRQLSCRCCERQSKDSVQVLSRGSLVGMRSVPIMPPIVRKTASGSSPAIS